MHDKTFSLKPVVLIVDDQVTDLRVLSTAVQDLAEVYIAQNGQQALEIARQCRPDVVLLDIEMPGISGFEVCRALKSDPELLDAAVIFVSAHTQTADELLALECGGVDFIQKPLNVPVARARIKAHIALRKEAKRLANHDALTGLPNRILLQDRTEQALQKARRSHGRVAMLLLDLDNFKVINDSMGHSVGDLVLQKVAFRLSRSLLSEDTVSRQGGDEFIVLLPEVIGFDAVGDFAQRVLATISSPFSIHGNRYDLGASIGISVFPEDSDDMESLYRHADAAMYQAKLSGRNRYCFFSSHIESSMRARHLLERHMRNALEEGVFEVFYQAKVDARHHRVIGMEALIRWRNPDGVLISPADFIPLAEETGLIIPIGKYVLLQACKDTRVLRELGHDISISVNISAVQFREASFLDMVKSILVESGLEARFLELEITEGVLARDIDNARETLSLLKTLGVRISIDDFGTGYSSLAYLKRFPIDVLKIDQSFVRDMLTDKSDSAIIEAIIKLGQALGLELVAEGVETQEQADTLLRQGCQIMQGYLYCRPIPFSQIASFLSSGLNVDVAQTN
ncbi:putative bifunctional diguanylate cyclase/phosphodiesterase [Pseudomonas frederiksbergensis]|uniref:cyclic-guanylate-specific phosphodiesterase n=1 Tax=Pseudomonas frederiksbergensis TaxID=104087 RepID=A0A423KCI0_9PSED|nr:EAL domain-containing protein [Pseudomonas frederiksbergensis]RON50029.1 GGDEF domain-containing response regulator [Pseudomonas frederiksbergensis]RON52226.1 GGDEF domain-containing response regulator [Pseudomonas frederiksbergensis]